MLSYYCRILLVRLPLEEPRPRLLVSGALPGVADDEQPAAGAVVFLLALALTASISARSAWSAPAASDERSALPSRSSSSSSAHAVAAAESSADAATAA